MTPSDGKYTIWYDGYKWIVEWLDAWDLVIKKERKEFESMDHAFAFIRNDWYISSPIPDDYLCDYDIEDDQQIDEPEANETRFDDSCEMCGTPQMWPICRRCERSMDFGGRP